ncbi:hypothetical protein [Lewinella sp. IMCC34191]|uniref:hypothetical protein n=1 Tax=Lewinella sp. IMCC34191 TaxID=2259172 RepID=UPI0013003D91|nr:hypothetical protein [Lewinella sp. IMCC34191]
MTTEVAPIGQEETPYRNSITETAFFEQLLANTSEKDVFIAREILQAAQHAGYSIEWKESAFAVKYPDPNGGPVLVSLFVVSRRSYFYLMPTEKQLDKLGIDKERGFEYARRIAAAIPAAEPGVGSQSSLLRYLRMPELAGHVDSLMRVVGDFVSMIDREAK